jgi:hypothetical protein
VTSLNIRRAGLYARKNTPIIELLERARANRPGIGAVFITSCVDHTWLNGKLADVKKPFTMEQLARFLSRSEV